MSLETKVFDGDRFKKQTSHSELLLENAELMAQARKLRGLLKECEERLMFVSNTLAVVRPYIGDGHGSDRNLLKVIQDHLEQNLDLEERIRETIK